MDTALLIQFAPLLIAPLASLLAKGAERLPVFPYVGGSKLGIVAALMLGALACRFGLAWATGTLPGINWEAELRLIYDALVAAGLAAGGYSVFRAKKPMIPGS